jgi:hypothetical protein
MRVASDTTVAGDFDDATFTPPRGDDNVRVAQTSSSCAPTDRMARCTTTSAVHVRRAPLQQYLIELPADVFRR